MFKRLSLLKQLGLLIVILTALIFFVVSPLINRNLNKLVSNQMFEIIKLNQLDYLQNFYNQFDKGKDKQVYHITRQEVNSGIRWEAVPPLTVNTTRDMVETIFAKKINTQQSESENYIGEYNGQKIYYTITKVDDTQHIISFLYNEYSTELLTSIRNELIYVQYIVLFIMAFIITGWVWGLIRPLHKIENYINSIKRNEKETLNIVRDDEIGQISRALIEMKYELDKQEKLKEEFMHNISHDLKTPIAVIKSYAQSMKDDIYPYGTKDASLDVILENTDRLESKVKSFLYLNRLDYINQEELILEDVNMNQLIERVKSQLDVNGTLIEIEQLDTAVIFKGQEEHWRNVVENVVENAKRYCKNTIKITLKQDALVIFNDGPPIDDDFIQEIFRPYTKGEKGNFGLGLSIVKKVIDMYGYKIIAENVESGVQFEIYK